MSRFDSTKPTAPPTPTAPPAPAAMYPHSIRPSAPPPPASIGDPAPFASRAAGGAGVSSDGVGLFRAAHPPVPLTEDPMSHTAIKSAAAISKAPLEAYLAAEKINRLPKLMDSLRGRLDATSGDVIVSLQLTRTRFHLVVEYATPTHAMLLQECFTSYFASRAENRVSDTTPSYYMTGGDDGLCWGIRPSLAHVDYWFNVTGDSRLEDAAASSIVKYCLRALKIPLVTVTKEEKSFVLADIEPNEVHIAIPSTHVTLKAAWDFVEAFSNTVGEKVATKGKTFTRKVVHCERAAGPFTVVEGALATMGSTTTTTLGLGR